MSRGAIPPGRYREKLADQLQAAGIDLRPADIVPAGGRWRNKTAFGDGTRWWATGTTKGCTGLPDGLPVICNGYSTIKDCARSGIRLDRDAQVATHYDVWAVCELSTP